MEPGEAYLSSPTRNFVRSFQILYDLISARKAYGLFCSLRGKARRQNFVRRYAAVAVARWSIYENFLYVQSNYVEFLANCRFHLLVDHGFRKMKLK